MGAQLACFDQISFLIEFYLSKKTLCPFFNLKNENSKLQCKSNIDARLIFNFSLLALNVLMFKKLPTTSDYVFFFEKLKLKRRKRFEKQIFLLFPARKKQMSIRKDKA